MKPAGRGAVLLGAETEAGHVQHAQNAAQDEDDDILVLGRQGIQQAGHEKPEAEVEDRDNHIPEGEPAAADPEGRQVGKPGEPADVDHRGAAGRNAQEEDHGPKGQSLRILGHDDGNEAEEQPQRPGKHAQGHEIFFSFMGPVDQHGEGNLQQGSGLGNAVDDAEGQVSRFELIGKADHGGGSAAADGAEQIAEQIAQQNQRQASADGLGQAGFVVEQGEGIVGETPEKLLHAWTSFQPAACEIGEIIAYYERSSRGKKCGSTGGEEHGIIREDHGVEG